jgi:hypothetical protein
LPAIRIQIERPSIGGNLAKRAFERRQPVRSSSEALRIRLRRMVHYAGMGGIGGHPVESYGAQSISLLASFLCAARFPGGVLALLLGSWWERARRATAIDTAR